MPVRFPFTETGTLSGRSCGIGSFVRTQVGGGLVPASTSLSAAYAGTFFTIPNQGALVSTNNSNWQTATPRFVIQYASYIAVDHIDGPHYGCFMPSIPYSRGFLTYKGDAFRGTYRTTESVLFVPIYGLVQNFFFRGGPTRNYETPSSPVAGYSHNLSSTPTGDLWIDPYTGADEDEKQYDCNLWNDKSEADKKAMNGIAYAYDSMINTAYLRFYGFGKDPLEPQPPTVGIAWSLITSIVLSKANSTAQVTSGTHTCYPAHILKVNGVTIYDVQPSFNDIVRAGSCLASPSLPITPSLIKTVPNF